jgi:nucleoside-diphosphate-sugar epimerase
VQWLDADAAHTAALVRACGTVDVVVHAMNPAYTADAWRTQVPVFMEQAIAVAKATGALLMFPGNVYNFGSGMPAVLREETPQHADTVKGRVRVAVEQRLAAQASEGLRSVVIRAGDFFGAGTGTLLDMLIARDLRRGRIVLPGALDVATPVAYLPDLATAFVRVAQRADSLHGAEVFHFAGHSLSGSEWVEALEGAAREAGWLRGGQHARVSRLPWPVIRLGGLVVPQWASMAEMRYLWTTPHTLDNGRLAARIGSEPHTPFADAVRVALRHMGSTLPSADAAVAA